MAEDLAKDIDRVLVDRPFGAKWSVAVLDAQTGQPVYEREADRPVEAYSLGKLAIAKALAIETQHQPRLINQFVTIKPDYKVGGTGFLRYFPPHFEVKVDGVVGLMLSESDNTAAKTLTYEIFGSPGHVNDLVSQAGLELEHTGLIEVDSKRFGFGKTTANEIARLMIAVLNDDDAQYALSTSHMWYGLRREIAPPNQLSLKDKLLFRAAKYLSGRGPDWIYLDLLMARRPEVDYPSKEGSLEDSRHDVARIGQLVVAALSEGYTDGTYGPSHPAHQVHARLGQVVRDYQK